MSSALSGFAGGALTGAGTGMSIAPGPWGLGVGALVGGIAGLISGQDNDAAMRKARNTQVPLVDPREQVFLARQEQRAKQQAAATDPSSVFAITNARNVLGQTQSNINRNTTNPSQAISGILSAQDQTNRAVAQIGSNAGARANETEGLVGALVHNQAERERGLGEYKRDLAYSEWVNGKQNINNLLSQGLALAPQIMSQVRSIGPVGRPTAPYGGPAPPGAWRTQGVGTPILPMQQPRQYSTLEMGGPPDPITSSADLGLGAIFNPQ